MIILAACVCALFACANSDRNATTPSNYIISFNTNGGTPVKSLTLKSGSSLVLPEAPTREGYVFIGWFLDNKFEREVNPSMFRVVGNTTIFACWESVETYRHHINVETYDNGTITVLEPSDSRASMGTEVIVMVKPENGYELSDGTLMAGNISLEHESGDRYKFTMPPREVLITCKFELKPMSVKVIGNLVNGEIVLSSDAARSGDLVSVQAIPDYGYRLAELFVINNSALGTDENFKINIKSTGAFYMGSNEAFVGATFEKIDYDTEYNINVVSSKGGNIVLSDMSISAGLFVNLSFEPEEGYRLAYYSVQGEGFLNYVGTMQEGFIMPDHDVTVTANFTAISESDPDYELIIGQSANGEISLKNPKNNYKEGELVEINVAPNDGYALKNAYINGVPILAGSFRMPGAKSTVTSEFTLKGYKVGIIASNCKVNISQKTAYPGEIVYFEVIDEPGYKVSPSKLTLNGAVITGNSFVMPDCDVTISAVAYATGSTHAVIADSVNGGIIAFSEEQATIYTKIQLNAIPNAGYRFKKGSFTVSYFSKGETVTENLSGQTFIMPDTDVIVSCQFERVFGVSATDDGRIALYPSALEIAVGENIFVDFVAHGDIIESSVSVSVSFGTYTEDLNASRVFELTNAKLAEAGENPSLSFRYLTYSQIDGNRFYSITTVSGNGGEIVSEKSALYGSTVKLDIVEHSGYKLESLILSTNSGDTYPICDTFVMPDGAVTIKATFAECEERSFGLANQYINNAESFTAAKMEVVYYREKYQFIDAFPALESNPFINYIVGAVKVNSKYGHDFYVIEVNDISRVNPISYICHDFIANELGVGRDEVNVQIRYNYIVLSVGGNPEEDFFLYRNGVKAISDFIIYERDNGTYGIYAYTGSGGYVSLIESYNGRSVSYLSSHAFDNPESIMGISLGNVREIGDYAFEGTAISYIDLSVVSKLGVGVFKDTSELKGITVSSHNPYYYSLSGVLYERGKAATETLYCYPQGKTSVNNAFELPSQTKKIASYAFYKSPVKVLSYGGALTTIGDFAFAYSELESIKYSSTTAISGVADFSTSTVNKSNVSTFGEGAFKGVYTLKNFYLDSITEIGNEAISWDGVSSLVINLSGSGNGVVKAYGFAIEIPSEHTGVFIINVPVALKELYGVAKGWTYYLGYFNYV